MSQKYSRTMPPETVLEQTLKVTEMLIYVSTGKLY